MIRGVLCAGPPALPKGVTVHVHGMGPFTATDVNPADDPRKAAPPAN